MLRYGVVLLVCAMVLAAPVKGSMIHFREGGGDDCTDVVFDDGFIDAYDMVSGDPHGDGDYNGITANTVTSTYGGSWHMNHRKVSYYAIKDMFAHLPPESTIILSATLHVTANYATDTGTMAINPVTTDWLVGAAGTNEHNVSGFYCDNANTTTWAGGGNFHADNDLDLVNQSTCLWTGADGYHRAISFDVTEAIQGIFANEINYGIMLRPIFEESEETQSANFLSHGSEYGTDYRRPSLEIEYIPEPATVAMLGLGALALIRRRGK